MTWSRGQKQIAARACHTAGITEEHRRLILGQFDGRAMVHGRATSTARALTQRDFEDFMATVEACCPNGQLLITRQDGKRMYGMHHWQRAAQEGAMKRLRWNVRAYDDRLRKAGLGLPIPSPSTVTDGRTNEIDHLTTPELEKLRSALYAMAKRHRVLERSH